MKKYNSIFQLEKELISEGYTKLEKELISEGYTKNHDMFIPGNADSSSLSCQDGQLIYYPDFKRYDIVK